MPPPHKLHDPQQCGPHSTPTPLIWSSGGWLIGYHESGLWPNGASYAYSYYRTLIGTHLFHTSNASSQHDNCNFGAIYVKVLAQFFFGKFVQFFPCFLPQFYGRLSTVTVQRNVNTIFKKTRNIYSVLLCQLKNK